MRTWLLMLPLLLGAWLAGAPAHAADEFLDPTEAFRGSARIVDPHTLEIRFDIAPGYYLYRERFSIVPGDGNAQLGAFELPQGKVKFDETFQKDVETYRGALVVTVPVTNAAQPFRLKVNHQGCADRGLCYPPSTAAADVQAGGGAMTAVQWQVDADAAPLSALPPAAPSVTPGATPGAVAKPTLAATPASSRPAAATGDEGRIDAALHSGNLALIGGVFLLAGLLLSFTPCVLPMLPILSSIIVGQGAPVSRGRGFALALSYSLGMALVYTAFGVIAGLLGEGLAAALQNPWVLGAFALLLATLSLSMFGVFELQVPNALQSRIAGASSRLPGGKHAGVFVMGGLSALIVGPCVAAPLAGALVYISQTRDVLIGGLALFALACGMSVPLLLLGASAGSLLPRAGAWMETVKRLFGVLLLAVALWIVQPVLPGWALMLLLGAAGLLGAAYLRVFDRLPAEASGWWRLGKGLGLVLAVLGVAQIVGALSGGQSALQPLRHLAGGASTVAEARGVSFQRVRSVAELDAALQSAGRPVMLDFYADWCVSCKEMEQFTFTDPAIRQRLGGALLLQADVTANSDDDRALLKRFGLFGPPGILFFDARGGELPPARVVGFLAAQDFGAKLGLAGL